jgi:hypothetical protein
MSQTNNIEAIFGTVVGTNATGGGSIVLSQPNPIPFGTTLEASAVPISGNYFVIWSGAASGTNSPTTVVVTGANPTINVLFTTLPGGKYSLAVVVMGNGSVAVSPQQNYYNPGDSVTLSASTTNAGTSFYGWTGDVSGTNSSIVVVMNTSKVVQANFGALPTNVAAQVIVNPAGVSPGFYPGLTINGVAGYSDIIQGSADLTDTNGWVTVTNLTLAQPVQLRVDTNVNASSPFNSRHFYKVLPGQ